MPMYCYGKSRSRSTSQPGRRWSGPPLGPLFSLAPFEDRGELNGQSPEQKKEEEEREEERGEAAQGRKEQRPQKRPQLGGRRAPHQRWRGAGAIGGRRGFRRSGLSLSLSLSI